MTILQRLIVNLFILAILFFVVPAWSPLPCSTSVVSKACVALILLIAANVSFNILAPFLPPPANLKFPYNVVVRLVKVIRPFQDFSYGTIIAIIVLTLAALVLQYVDYQWQRSQAIMPVIQAVTVKTPDKPPQQIQPGDQIEVIAGGQALFSAEMLQDSRVECLWSASRGVVHKGAGCSAVYVAPPEKGYDALSLAVQSNCQSMRTVRGIAVLVR